MEFRTDFYQSTPYYWGRCSSVSIMSDYELNDRQEDFSCSLCVQTGSGAYPASCPTGTGVLSSGGKARPGRDATIHPHLVPRSRMSRSCNSSPTCASMVCKGTALAFSTDIMPQRMALRQMQVSNCKWTDCEWRKRGDAGYFGVPNTSLRRSQ
jgi:hypothetical protein